MPVFNYKCLNKECEHEFWELHSYNSIKRYDCPECGYVAERIMQNSSTLIKGKGFYAEGTIR